MTTVPSAADLSARLAQLSPERRALLERALRKMAPAQPTGIARRNGDGPAPLSYAQEFLWLIEQAYPGRAPYNVPRAFRVRGALDVAALESALGDLVERHAVLRTRIESGRGGRDAARRAGAAGARRARAMRRTTRRCTPRCASMRAVRSIWRTTSSCARSLVRTGADEAVLQLVVHHVTSDGWSRNVTLRDLGALYAARRRGERATLEPLPIEYADYAVWQRAGGRARRGGGSRLVARRAGGRARTARPADATGRAPARRASRARACSATIPRETLDALAELARRENASLFMVLLAAYGVLLHRHTGRRISSSARRSRDARSPRRTRSSGCSPTRSRCASAATATRRSPSCSAACAPSAWTRSSIRGCRSSGWRASCSASAAAPTARSCRRCSRCTTRRPRRSCSTARRRRCSRPSPDGARWTSRSPRPSGPTDSACWRNTVPTCSTAARSSGSCTISACCSARSRPTHTAPISTLPLLDAAERAGGRGAPAQARATRAPPSACIAWSRRRSRAKPQATAVVDEQRTLTYARARRRGEPAGAAPHRDGRPRRRRGGDLPAASRRDGRRAARDAQGGRALRAARSGVSRRPAGVHPRGLRGRRSSSRWRRRAARVPASARTLVVLDDARRRAREPCRGAAGRGRRARVARLRDLHVGLDGQAEGRDDPASRRVELPAQHGRAAGARRRTMRSSR